MKNIKEFLIKHKTILLVLCIAITLILAVMVMIGRTAGDKRIHPDPELSASDAIKEKKTEEERTSDDQETTALTDVSAEVETDADGSISSVVTEDGQKIDLSDEHTQKETAADGSVIYTKPDGSQIILHTDGSTTIQKKEPDDKREETSDTSVAANPGTSQTPGQTTQDKPTASQPAADTPVQSPQTPTNPQPQEPSQAPPQDPVPPTACTHSSTIRRVIAAASSASKGSWEEVCSSCGTVLTTGIIPAHSAYQVDLGGGKTATVYGYYEEEVASEIFRQLNQYRQENGLNTLENRFHTEANIRALECSYSYSHERPNGNDIPDLNPLIYGENIDVHFNFVGSVENFASSFMADWKHSHGHNLTMLIDNYNLGGVGVFTRIIFDEQGTPTNIETYAVQNFGIQF